MSYYFTISSYWLARLLIKGTITLLSDTFRSKNLVKKGKTQVA